MCLQHHAPPSLGVIEPLEQQVLVTVGRVMLESLPVHRIRLGTDLLDRRGRQEAADDGVPKSLKFLDELLHRRLHQWAKVFSTSRQLKIPIALKSLSTMGIQETWTSKNRRIAAATSASAGNVSGLRVMI